MFSGMRPQATGPPPRPEIFVHPNKCIYIYLVWRMFPHRNCRACAATFAGRLEPLPNSMRTRCDRWVCGPPSSPSCRRSPRRRSDAEAAKRNARDIDSTTLSRTLRIMAKEGWIAERRRKDRRERWLGLTRSGEAHFKRALPAWKRAKRACVVSWESPPGITFWKSHIRSRTW